MLYYDLEIDKEYVSENYLYKKTEDVYAYVKNPTGFDDSRYQL